MHQQLIKAVKWIEDSHRHHKIEDRMFIIDRKVVYPAKIEY